LERARAASRAGASAEQVDHLAYVASQRAAYAEARAGAEVARSEIAVLQRALGHVIAVPRAASAPREPPVDAPAANATSLAQELTLPLAELPFEGAEPSSQALEELEALADWLRREPSRSVVIEAEFDLPDPGARTTIERRVEVVRAILLQRGVTPARLLVRSRVAAATESVGMTDRDRRLLVREHGGAATERQASPRSANPPPLPK
jgi:OmpA-OmpF porin, OOP family